VPGVEDGAQRGAGVAGGGLHEDVLPIRGGLDRGDQQGVEREPSGEAEVAAPAYVSVPTGSVLR
jgi:hypothetical protein